MALPKIGHPIFETEIPLSKTAVKFRSMLGKEEKMLLIAKQADDHVDKLNAVKQVVNNCVVSKIDVDQLNYYELEYLFLKIREMSVSSIAKASYRDAEDDKVYNFDVDLSKVVVKGESNTRLKLSLTGVDVEIRYPSATTYVSNKFATLKPEEIFEYLVAKCITGIYQGDKASDLKTVTEQQMLEFVQSIPSKQYQQIQEYFDNAPSLYYKIEYQNSNDTKRVIELTSLEDFFTF